MSYTDLTGSWEHGTLITCSLLQNMADNDESSYILNKIDSYCNFESYREMIDYGYHPNPNNDSETPDVEYDQVMNLDITDYSGNHHVGTIQNTIAEFNAENGTADDVIADNIGGDPLITTDDFKLTSSSPCIDTGITLTYITDDYLGRTRPNNLYDIGAFEYFHAYMTNMTINTGTIK